MSLLRPVKARRPLLGLRQNSILLRMMQIIKAVYFRNIKPVWIFELSQKPFMPRHVKAVII